MLFRYEQCPYLSGTHLLPHRGGSLETFSQKRSDRNSIRAISARPFLVAGWQDSAKTLLGVQERGLREEQGSMCSTDSSQTSRRGEFADEDKCIVCWNNIEPNTYAEC